MGKPVDRDKEYMYKMWGTTSLITDYNSNLLREVTTERYLKNKEFEHEIHENIPNSNEILVE